MTKKKEDKEQKHWLIKHKWDVVFYVFLALVIFVPSVRMPVVSTIQRIFAFAPSELSETKQRSVRSFDWPLMNENGQELNFSQSSGRVAVINLWATWCPPCVAEMPSFQKVYDKYGDQVDFYFVSNEDPNTIERFITQKEYTLPTYIPLGNNPREFNSNSLPTTYVLNKEGKIVIEEVGASDWNSRKFHKKLDELLAE